MREGNGAPLQSNRNVEVCRPKSGGRRRLSVVDATLRKRAAPECRYVVVDADGRIALLGVLFPREDLTFAVELDSRLPAGHYIVMAEIRVNGNAMNPEIERIPVVIGGKP